MTEPNVLSNEQLKELISGAVTETISPVQEELKGLKEKIGDIEKRAPAILEENPQEEETPKEKKSFAEKRLHFQPKRADPSQQVPEDEFSFLRFVQAQNSHDWDNAPYERYAWEETQKKQMTWLDGSAGGYWVDNQFLPDQFIELLYANIVCRKAGCTTISATRAPVQIPRMTAGTTAYWLPQATEITHSDATPGELKLVPKFCLGRTSVSRFMAQTSAGAAERILREDLARQIALEVDEQMLIGTGTSSKPTGLLNWTATGNINSYTIATDGGALTFAHLCGMLNMLEVDNVPEDGIVWIMHPRTWNGVRQLVDTNGRPIFHEEWYGKEPRSVLGYPVYRTTQLPINLTKGSGTDLALLFCVNIKEVILCEWGAIEIEGTSIGGDAWKKNLVEVKATYTMDCGVRHGVSVCECNESTT